MNFAALLSTGPKLKAAPVRLPTNKTEAHIKATNAVQEACNQKYRKAFAKFPDMVASTTQIAGSMGSNTSATSKQLKVMSLRQNPVLEKVGEIPHNQNGNPTFVWKWIGK